MADARARHLGTELRRLREHTGLSGDNLAAKLGWAPSKVSRYERARTVQKPREVGRYLDVIRVGDPQRAELVAIAEAIYAGRSPEDCADPLADEYAAAAVVQDWALLTFPRALQTADYARHALASSQEALLRLPSHIAASAEASLAWQSWLAGPSPGRPQLQLRAVFDQGCLHRQVGPPAVLRAQLEHLADLAGYDGARVRMLPYAAGGPRVEPFTYFRYRPVAGCEVPDSVVLQGLHGVTLVDAERDVYCYERAFRALWEAALGEDETAEAARRACKEQPG